ncbi:MAG: hypothetical protein VX938_09970 [Myxococcota bacterium]|nr:hypothetical protein [Myxococcota bacterium]
MRRPIMATAVCAGLLFVMAGTASARHETAPSSALGMGDTANASAVGPAALHLNPAGMSQARQYAFEVGYNFFENGPGHALVASAVDSKKNPALSMGVSYAHLISERNGADREGYAVRSGLGTGFHNQTFGMSVGVSGNMLRITNGAKDDDENGESDDLDNISMDAGVILDFFHRFRIGCVGRNLFHTEDEKMLLERDSGKEIGAGLAVAIKTLELSFDMDFGMDEKWTDYRVGGQWLLMGALVLRTGFTMEEVRDGTGERRNHLAAGVGYVSQIVAADLAMKAPLDESGEVIFSAGFRYFLP